MGELEKVKKFLQSNRGYLKKSSSVIATRLGVDELVARKALYAVKKEIKETNYVEERKEVQKVIERPKVPIYIPEIITSHYQNVMVVGDLHAPFILDNYLEWCYNLSREYKTNKTIFIGDIIDSHSWSYHEKDVDGWSVGDELEAAKKQLKLAYKLFPKADITLGNHDLLIARKAKTAGLSRKFIRDLGEVLECPKEWNFVQQVNYHDVNYIHGSIGNAFIRAKDSRTSTVQGHLHSQAFIQYSVSDKDAIFGMQLGAGLDHSKYAFEYAKPMTKKPIVSAGVVLENGSLPILRLMKL